MFGISHRYPLYSFLCTVCFRKYAPKCFIANLRFLHRFPNSILLKFPEKSTFTLHEKHNYGFTNDAPYPHNLRLLLNNLDFDVKHCNRIYRSDIEKILDDFESRDDITEADGILLLQSTSDLLLDQLPEEKIKLIWKIWNTVRNKGIITLELYHTLLTSLSKHNESIDAEEILNMIENDKIKPTELTYSLLLMCLCECTSMTNAIKLVNVMKNRDLQLNDISFASLIYGYEKLGDVQKSTDLLETMEIRKIAPNSKVYCNLLRGVAETSNQERFGKIWYQMTSFGINLSEKEKISVIRSLSKGNLHSLIPHVLGEIKSQYKLPIMANLCVELSYLGMYKSVFTIVECFNENFYATYNNKPYIVYIIEEILNSKAAPIHEIITFCSKIGNESLRLLETVAYFTLSNQLTDEAYLVFKEMFTKGLPIRGHYFRPIIIAEARKSGERGVLNVLEYMLKNFYVVPDFETFCLYVYPNMNLDSPLLTLRKLQDVGFSVVSSFTALLGALLNDCRLQAAIELSETVQSKIYYAYIENILIEAFLKTGDVNSILKLMKLLKAEKSIGNFLIEICNQKKMSITVSTLKALADGIFKFNFMVPWSAVEEVKSYIHKKPGFDDAEEDIMQKLTNNVSYQDSPFIKHPNDMELEELENHLTLLKSKNMNTRGTLRRLLIVHSGQGNINRVRELLQDIKENNYTITPGMKASMIEVFARNNDVNTALSLLRELEEEAPEFKIDSFKYINLANALVSNNKFRDALDVLKMQNPSAKTDMLSQRCWILLNTVAGTLTPVETKKILKKLVDYNYCNYTGQLMGPIIKSYFRRDDAIGAAYEFLAAAESYHIAPMKREVMCELARLSKMGNADADELLEQVLQTSRSVHGTGTTNVAYMFALAEANHITRLKSFLSNTSTVINTKVLAKDCDRLSDRNRTKVLMNLAKVCAEFPSINADPIYISLLKLYYRNDDYQSGMELLTLIEETDRKPSEEFLRLLSSFKKSKQSTSI